MVSTHLKNISQHGPFPQGRDDNKTCLKPVLVFLLTNSSHLAKSFQKRFIRSELSFQLLRFVRLLHSYDRWAPIYDRCKVGWNGDPINGYKWAYNWVTGVITHLLLVGTHLVDYIKTIQGANPSLKLIAIAPGKWWKMETILFARIFDLSVSSWLL